MIENTGPINANKHGKLSFQNPSYTNYNRLTTVFGVKVISTPTLLSIAQLQNFYLHTSISRNWTHYSWPHMDVVALLQEDFSSRSPHRPPLTALSTFAQSTTCDTPSSQITQSMIKAAQDVGPSSCTRTTA